VAELNAITLRTTNMAAAVAFYEVLGCTVIFGGPDEEFTSLRIDDHRPGSGTNFVNLTSERTDLGRVEFWGRYIIFVDDPDDHHRRLIDAGYVPMMAPSNAPWKERYFHVKDPDGHEVSLARPLRPDER
jgi:catechol 2,3-dioxygenase-like lactoylglutathione lyase family enzyme